LARVLGASLGFFGFVGVCFFLGRVVQGFWLVLGGLLGWGASGQVWKFDWGFLLYLGVVGSTVCWAFDGDSTILWVFCGFSWVFFCGIARLFMCILPVYLGAPYAFLIKFSYLSKKISCQIL
jgi:hypothetical protein